MVTYVVASKANTNQLAQCQILGEHIEKNVPDCSVKFVIKDKCEWATFIDSVCRTYGFDEKKCPIVYTLEGVLIGDGNAFIEEIKNKYKINVQMNKEELKCRTKLNVEKVTERMRKLNSGETLGEKIETYLQKKPKKNVAKQIDDSFYNQEWEAGIPFFVRRTNLLREFEHGDKISLNQNKTLNIPDIQLEQHLELEQKIEEDSKKDQTWADFLSQYQQHIEGSIDPITRTEGRYDENNPKPEEKEEEEAEELSRNEKSKSHMSGVSQKPSSQYSTMRGNPEKYDIPDDCKLEMLSKNRVEKLTSNYLLVQHPYPQIEGEMLIYQVNDEDKPKEGTMTYRDFSLRKRIPTAVTKFTSQAVKEKQMKAENTHTKLQCLEINTENPLSALDWSQISSIILETQALTWCQVLPVGQKSSQPYQFNSIHVLPNSKIDMHPPLDSMIASRRKYQHKISKKDKKPGQGAYLDTVEPTTKEKNATNLGLTFVPEFNFPHAIYEITPNEMSSDGLQLGYRKIVQFLSLKEQPELGVTIIVTPAWMFVATIQQPYHTETDSADRSIPVYHDGFSYAGIVNLQEIKQKWPATAGNGFEQYGILSSLKDQSEPFEQSFQQF